VWSELLFGDLPLAQAEREGTVHVEGDREAVAQIVRLYARDGAMGIADG